MNLNLILVFLSQYTMANLGLGCQMDNMQTNRNPLGNNTILGGLRLAFKDVSFAFIGLFVSIVIAVGVNSDITYSEVLYEIPNAFSSGISDFFKKLN